MNKLFALADTVTPKDLRDIAARYLKDTNRTIVTVSTKKGGTQPATGGEK
jgi:predicted Zn-dependent peptidase